MYNNLTAEMKRLKISNREMAQKIGVPESTFAYKMSKGDFTATEAIAIRELFFSNEEYKYLFNKTIN